MTTGQRAVLVVTYAVAAAAFVGVVSIALHTAVVFPGMSMAFAIGLLTGTAMTSQRGRR